MAETKIEWASTKNADGTVTPGKTWNPIVGCSIKSPGCKNCYAMAQSARIERMIPTLEHYRGLTVRVNGSPVWTGKIAMAPEATLNLPRRWHKPTTIFVNSMSDLFHEDVPESAQFRILSVMRECSWHTFQVLTKRPDVMLRALREYAPLRHVLIGVSAERQQEADQRRDDLAALAKAGWRTFVSYEPALGAVSWRGWEFLKWGIAGGESGHNARPCWVPGIRRTVQQWHAMGIPTFVKQLGANVCDRNDAGFDGSEPDSWPDMDLDAIEHDLDGTRDGYQGAPVRVHLKARKGGDMAEWPEDLRVREMPNA
jgi:protein gp37